MESLLAHPFFYPDATRSTAEAILRGESERVCIVRPSSQQNAVSVSWSEAGKIKHSLIQILDTGWYQTQVEDGSDLKFAQIETLLDFLQLVPFNSDKHKQQLEQSLTNDGGAGTLYSGMDTGALGTEGAYENVVPPKRKQKKAATGPPSDDGGDDDDAGGAKGGEMPPPYAGASQASQLMSSQSEAIFDFEAPPPAQHAESSQFDRNESEWFGDFVNSMSGRHGVAKDGSRRSGQTAGGGYGVVEGGSGSSADGDSSADDSSEQREQDKQFYSPMPSQILEGNDDGGDTFVELDKLAAPGDDYPPHPDDMSKKSSYHEIDPQRLGLNLTDDAGGDFGNGCGAVATPTNLRPKPHEYDDADAVVSAAKRAQEEENVQQQAAEQAAAAAAAAAEAEATARAERKKPSKPASKPTSKGPSKPAPPSSAAPVAAVKRAAQSNTRMSRKEEKKEALKLAMHGDSVAEFPLDMLEELRTQLVRALQTVNAGIDAQLLGASSRSLRQASSGGGGGGGSSSSDRKASKKKAAAAAAAKSSKKSKRDAKKESKSSRSKPARPPLAEEEDDGDAIGGIVLVDDDGNELLEF